MIRRRILCEDDTPANFHPNRLSKIHKPKLFTDKSLIKAYNGSRSEKKKEEANHRHRERWRFEQESCRQGAAHQSKCKMARGLEIGVNTA